MRPPARPSALDLHGRHGSLAGARLPAPVVSVAERIEFSLTGRDSLRRVTAAQAPALLRDPASICEIGGSHRSPFARSLPGHSLETKLREDRMQLLANGTSGPTR